METQSTRSMRAGDLLGYARFRSHFRSRQGVAFIEIHPRRATQPPQLQPGLNPVNSVRRFQIFNTRLSGSHFNYEDLPIWTRKQKAWSKCIPKATTTCTLTWCFMWRRRRSSQIIVILRWSTKQKPNQRSPLYRRSPSWPCWRSMICWQPKRSHVSHTFHVLLKHGGW